MRKVKERRGGGKAVNLYLQDTDTKRIGELTAYLAVNGHPLGISASRIIKAALRSVSPNAEFLEVYEKAITDDERTKAKRAKVPKK